jgi:endonuclease/exonuclease/phosphatase family metal-dependent hydrolase
MSNVMCTPTRTARMSYQLVAILIAIGSFAAGASAQTTVTLSTPGTHINADLTIQGGSSSLVDFSNESELASKVSSSADYTRRILMKFDTQNFVPANAVIQSAYLYLTLKHSDSTETRTLTAYHVTKSFYTGQTNWRYYRDGAAWSKQGGDLGASFGTTKIGDAEGTAYRLDLTRLVQASVNGDFGSSRYTRLALVDTGGVTSGNYKEFHSTRATSASQRPRLVITYGGGTTTVSQPSTSSTSGTTLRVMQWNIHKTKGQDGRCDPNRIATVIAAQNPHVVSLNEVNFFSGECAYTFDMGAKLEQLVEQKTGVTWYRQYVNVGGNGYGNVLLSRIRPVSDSSCLFSYERGMAQMTVPVNGRYVQVFSTHLASESASWRLVQIKQAVAELYNFTQPRIVMGDFNMWANTTEYKVIVPLYQDAWLAAKSAGTASAYNGTGNTRGGSRIDYVFNSTVSTLSLQSVKVPDSRVNGVFPSDHDPIVAVFKIN